MMSGWMVRDSMMKSGSCSSKYTKGHYGSKEIGERHLAELLLGHASGVGSQDQNAKGATDFSVAPLAGTLPRYFAESNYCSCGQVALAQVAQTVSGAAFHDGL